jgi:hypothetical protein
MEVWTVSTVRMYKYPDRRADRKISSIFSNLCQTKRLKLCIENTSMSLMPCKNSLDRKGLHKNHYTE